VVFLKPISPVSGRDGANSFKYLNGLASYLNSNLKMETYADEEYTPKCSVKFSSCARLSRSFFYSCKQIVILYFTLVFTL
jgi:hypothetical protein